MKLFKKPARGEDRSASNYLDIRSSGRIYAGPLSVYRLRGLRDERGSASIACKAILASSLQGGPPTRRSSNPGATMELHYCVRCSFRRWGSSLSPSEFLVKDWRRPSLFTSGVSVPAQSHDVIPSDSRRWDRGYWSDDPSYGFDVFSVHK